METVKIGARRVDSGETVQKKTPLEDEFHLSTLLQVELSGATVGAVVLRKGDRHFILQFGFEARGIHATLREEEIEPTFDAIEAGLKDLPPGERLTIHLGSFADDRQRQQQLDGWIDRAEGSELRYLLMGERARSRRDPLRGARDLTREGLRKPKFLHLYCTYTVDAGGAGANDALEKFLARLEKYWKTFTGEFERDLGDRAERIFAAAFADGYQTWEQLLVNKMGLSVRPLTAEELWAVLWERFNDTPPRPIPQLVVLDETGLREEVYSPVHPATVLLESERSVPCADRRWVHLKGKYQGVLTFIEKPGGWRDKNAQMRYLWEILARDRVYDTEIVCQLSRANETLVKSRMQSLTKQSNATALEANQKRTVDVSALLKVKKTLAAQEELYEGAVPLYVSTVFLVHRATRSDLDEACRYLESLFLRPAWVVRETEYPWKIWLQTFPLCWDALLAKPFHRRSIYLSSEAPGLMPLVRARSGDRGGFELIAEEGGTPVFLDLYEGHKNVGLFGTTRSGKSVLAAGLITPAIACGMPVVAMDYPKPDGTSTFSDYADFLGDRAAYYDIGSQSSNLFELPDLRGADPNLQKERLEDYKDFLGEVLLAMVMGKDGEGRDLTLADTARSILGIAIEAFFGDELIQERYGEAYKHGFGSLWGRLQ